MLSPSDFNNAVPQFTNGDYASNPINPKYVEEPKAVDYNRGAEPLQTLPAQWWNWFINRFTNRFNKVNIYVKNIFNELTQLLSLVSETPSGTESTPTVGQMKDMFETKYPDYLKTTPALSNTYVPQTTRVNGHELCENITITCVACASCNGSGTAFGTAATKNTGTAAGCIPIVGTALGTTNGQFIATDASGCLKPSGYTASCFRASTWTPSLVSCACYGKNGNTYSVFGSNAFNSTAFTTCTGTVTKVKVGTAEYSPSSGVISLPAYPSIPSTVACADKIRRNSYTNAYLFTVALTNGCSTADGTDLYASCKCLLTFCSTTGVLSSVAFCGAVYGCACCAGRDGSGCAFGTAARYACERFRPSTWTPSCVSCSHCSDYSEIAYVWRPIFYSTGLTTVNCCCVCLWNIDSSGTMRLCNMSNCGVLVSYFHCFDNHFFANTQLVPPHKYFDLGSCWNCLTESESQCICVYMFK